MGVSLIVVSRAYSFLLVGAGRLVVVVVVLLELRCADADDASSVLVLVFGNSSTVELRREVPCRLLYFPLLFSDQG